MDGLDSVEARSRAHYDAIAGSYDAVLDSPGNRRLRECFWRYVEAAVPRPARLLDFGAGSGIDAAHFAALGHDVTAYDLSEAMIAILQRRCAAAIADGKVTALAGPLDAVQGKLAARAPFDAIVSNFAVFSTIARLDPLFRRLGALARPGAPLIASIQNPWYPGDMRSTAFWRALLAAPFTGSLRYPSAGLRHVHHYTPGQLRRAARPAFEPDARPPPACGNDCFGPRSPFRVVSLRRS
ncbi:MAG TPA: class I SAM-dependent methyltransferase [Croceibacterium sp.]|nr:class I SAM-dependent methyltransferase [Croceibacterium sp.]